MIDFLSRVLSSTGFVCLATPATEFKGYMHYRLESFEKACVVAQHLVTEKKNVYFAIGTLKERQIEVDGKKKVRVAANIHEIKSLILDLDVGPTKDYKTQGEAVQTLVRFTKDVGLPMPLVVSSGYGVHVYWPFTKAISSDLWRKLAYQFKGLVEGYGLHADPARTSDVSSILRLPGSYNFKDLSSPQEVKILSRKPVPDTPAAVLAKIIIAANKSMSIVAKTPAVKQDTTVSGLGVFEVAQEPADFKMIVQKCQQVRNLHVNQATIAEPIWVIGLQLVRHCSNSENNAHAISRKHPTYSKDDTDARLARLEAGNIGPTLCDTFDQRNPGGCQGCPHRGKIRSPIVLGRGIKEATDAPTMVIDHGGGETSTVILPLVPFPYMRTSTGAIAMRIKDEDGNWLAPTIIYDYDIHPTKRMYDEVERTELFFFRSYLPHDGWREYPVPAYLIYDQRKLLELLARQGVMPDLSLTANLVGYMLGYIQSLQRQIPADQIYSQFGWRKDNTEIIIGERGYTTEGAKAIKVNEQFRHVISKLESKGSLDAWKKVVNVYNHEGAEDFAFGLMMGFGQLLFKFTGYEGAVFNLNGPSGAGKSTVLQVIHSIYGLPTEKALLHQDTLNAKLTVLGCYNNLPVTYDEITNIDPWEASDLVYAVSNGRGKESLKQDRTLRANTTTWATTLYASSNGSLTQMLSGLKGTSSGEMYRVMERTVSVSQRYTLNEAKDVFAPLATNYGIAGGIIAQWLVENLEQAKEIILGYFKVIGDRVSATSSERFWVAMCAQAAAGAYIGKMLGLHEYSVDATLNHACKIISEARGEVVVETKTPVDVLVEYINAHMSNMLVVRATPSGVSVVVVKPMGSMLLRHELDTSRLYLSKHALKAWCTEKNHNLHPIQKYLEQSQILLSEQASKALGEGTEFVTGRSVCWLIDTAHEAMVGAAALKAVGVAA